MTFSPSALALSGAALALISVLIAADRALRSARPLPAPWIILGLLAPALLIGAAVVAPASKGAYELSVLDLRATRQALPLSVGGDACKDSLVVTGAPAGLARLQLGPDGQGLALTAAAATATGAPGQACGGDVAEPPAARSSAFVLATSDEPSPQIYGSRPLRPGDLICVGGCGPGGVQLRLAADGSSLLQDGKPLRLMPTRRMLKVWGYGGLAGLAYWDANQRIYPLRDYGRAGQVQPGTAPLDPCQTRFLCANGQPLRSFIYRVGGPALKTHPGGLRSKDWRIMLLDPQVSVGGKGPEGPQVLAETGADERRSVDLTVYEVRYSSVDADPNDDSLAPAVLRSRRSLTVHMDPVTSRLRLHTPISELLRFDELRPAAGQDARTIDHVLEVSGGRDVSHQVEAVNVVSAPALGGRLNEAHLQIGARAKVVDGFSILGVNKSELSYGAKIPLMSGAGERAPTALIRLDNLKYPPLLVWLGPFALFLLVIALVGERLTSEPLLAACLSAIQLLLALRVLTAWASCQLDAGLDWRASMVSETAAYALLPCLILLIWPWTLSRWASLAIAAFAVAFMIGNAISFDLAIGAEAARHLFVPLGILVVCLILAGWRALGFGRLIPAGWRALLFARLAWLARLVSPRLEDGSEADSRAALRAVRLYSALAVALGLLRVMIALIGAKERVGPLMVSVIYTPLILMLLALLLDALLRLRGGRIRSFAGVWFGVILVGLTGAPALLSDNGYVLIVMPCLGLVAAAIAWRRSPGQIAIRLSWLGAPVLALGLLAYSAVHQVALMKNLEVARHAPSDAAAAQALENLAAYDQNKLRLVLWLNRALVARMGTDQSEKLGEWSAYLHDYTDTVIGRGYLSYSRLGQFRELQYWDNQSAIHLISPFGRLGAGLLLAALALVGVIYGRSVRLQDGPGWMRLAAAMAGWLAFGTAAYMILANMQALVPFTGRNIYLLAPMSRSDLLEGGLVLIGGAVLARLALRREAPA